MDALEVSTQSPRWTLALILSAYSRTTNPFVGTAFGVRNDGPLGPWAKCTLGGRASFYVTLWASVWMAAILPRGLVRLYVCGVFALCASPTHYSRGATALVTH